jgi:protein kinase A
MAPEIVLSLGHAAPVDFWGLGVLIYELLCAATPFDVEAEGNEREIFERVIRCQRYLTFPMGFGANARSIIRKLIHPTPGLRLGALKSGFEDIKQHLFFIADGATDWKAVEAGIVDPKIFMPAEVGLEGHMHTDEQQRRHATNPAAPP